MLCLAPLHVAGQELISPQEFLDRVAGKTVEFRYQKTGQLAGVEHFLSSTETVWSSAAGGCRPGQIFINGRELCFHYPTQANEKTFCWYPFRKGDQLMVRFARFNMPVVQIATSITDEPLDCDGPPMS